MSVDLLLKSPHVPQFWTCLWVKTHCRVIQVPGIQKFL